MCVNILSSTQSHIMIIKHFFKLHCFRNIKKVLTKPGAAKRQSSWNSPTPPGDVQNSPGPLLCGEQRACCLKFTRQHWGSYQAVFVAADHRMPSNNFKQKKFIPLGISEHFGSRNQAWVPHGQEQCAQEIMSTLPTGML